MRPRIDKANSFERIHIVDKNPNTVSIHKIQANTKATGNTIVHKMNQIFESYCWYLLELEVCSDETIEEEKKT